MKGISQHISSRGSPSALMVAVVTGAIGLSGMAVGNYITAQGNLAVERQRIEGQLILRALTGDPEESANNLLFLKDMGFLHDPNRQIEKLRSSPQEAPTRSTDFGPLLESLEHDAHMG